MRDLGLCIQSWGRHSRCRTGLCKGWEARKCRSSECGQGARAEARQQHGAECPAHPPVWGVGIVTGGGSGRGSVPLPAPGQQGWASGFAFHCVSGVLRIVVLALQIRARSLCSQLCPGCMTSGRATLSVLSLSAKWDKTFEGPFLPLDSVSPLALKEVIPAAYLQG